jgi:copper chaperone CopZ
MSRWSTSLLAAALLLSASTNTADAGQVTIKGVHLCCGACQSRAEKALKGIPGLTKAAVDRNSRVISFFATNDKTVTAGIASLAGSGFYGAAVHDKKPVKFPATGAKQGARGDAHTLRGLHLCCDACVVGAQKAVETVKGLQAIEIDRKQRTVKVIGQSISLLEAIQALNKAGFYSHVHPPKDKPKPKPKN